MTLGEDTAFTLEFLKSAHFGIYVPVIGYHYRRYDESSASTGYKEGHFESMCKLYSLKREYITQAYPVEKNIEKEICKEAYMGILWQLDDINDLPISKKERKQRISSKIKSKEFQNILREQRTLSAFLLKYTNYQTYAFAMKIRNKLLRR